MNLHHSEGLTLRTYSYGESHKIGVFLCRKFGQLRALAYGVKKPGSRFGSSLEPFTRCRLIFYRKQNQELAVLKSSEILQAFPAYRQSWEVNLHYGYFAELVMEFSREGAECETLYRLVGAVLDASQSCPIEAVARYFELWLLRLEGVLPPLQGKLPSALAAKTENLLREPPSQLEKSSWEASELVELEGFSERLIEYHLEKRLKTRRMLKGLLNSRTTEEQA